ncbi:MAG: hypothetical protein WCW35_09090 [Bacteroidota bacterium]
MKQMKYFLAVVCAAVLLTGCTNESEPTDEILSEDAAESISAAVGDESGGATDNFADVMIAGGGGSFGSAEPVIDGPDKVAAGLPSYDSLTGWWSVSVVRERMNDRIQRSITREYQYQFQKNGTVQKFYAAGSDTATTLKFKIISGTGYFRGPRVSHTLTKLSGAWTANEIDKDTVTITLDSTYVRSGSDSIKTRNMLRTHTGTMTITGVSVKALRFKIRESELQRLQWRNDFPNTISGTISGNYTATITHLRGEAYKERSINRDFTITVGGGEGTLTINGRNGSFRIDMSGGQRK